MTGRKFAQFCCTPRYHFKCFLNTNLNKHSHFTQFILVHRSFRKIYRDICMEEKLRLLEENKITTGNHHLNHIHMGFHVERIHTKWNSMCRFHTKYADRALPSDIIHHIHCRSVYMEWL